MSRRFIFIILLVVATSVFCASQASNPQKEASPLNPTEPPKTPEALVAFLLPDNSAFPERLKQVPREDAIKALTQAQTSASGSKADAIAYLLVILESDPDANRGRLYDALRNCTRGAETCDDRLLAYLTNLFDRGDKNVLDPLLDASRTSDSAFVEALGSTYDDVVAGDPSATIAALSRRPPKEQRRICHMIAAGDGTGLPDENSNEVITSLEEMSRQLGPVASTAMMCLSEIKAFDRR